MFSSNLGGRKDGGSAVANDEPRGPEGAKPSPGRRLAIGVAAMRKNVMPTASAAIAARTRAAAIVFERERRTSRVACTSVATGIATIQKYATVTGSTTASHLFVSVVMFVTSAREERKPPPAESSRRNIAAQFASIAAPNAKDPRVEKMFKENPPDLIHCSSPGALIWTAVGLSDKYNVPLVQSYHTHIPHYIPRYTWSGLVKPMWDFIRFWTNKSDVTMVTSSILQDELDDPTAVIPIDKPDCNVVYSINPREVKYDPRTIADAAKIFHAAGESWTMASEGWDMTNFGLFSGDDDLGGSVAGRLYEKVNELRGKLLVISECGHGFRSTRCEGPNWAKFDVPFVMDAVTMR